MNEKDIDVIDSIRLLGTIIQKELQWDLNTRHLVKKANARMEILRRVSSFGAPIQDLKEISILFIKSLLEQSATVWHSSLTKENAEDLERVQKIALRIIFDIKHTKKHCKNWFWQVDKKKNDKKQEQHQPVLDFENGVIVKIYKS